MTSHEPTLAPTLAAPTTQTVLTRLQIYAELSKARLSTLVLLTVFVGFMLGSTAGLDWVMLLHVLGGVALAAAGASALNQRLEHIEDSLMERTQNRPLPSGRVEPLEAMVFGVACCAGGFLWLALAVNMSAAFLAALTVAVYLFIYTPMKKLSSANTLVGAVAGALPPVIGWVGASGGMGRHALALFIVLFMWQLPHFLAIAWFYRKDYLSAGMKMMGLFDEEGVVLSQLAMLFCVAMLPASLLPTMWGMAGVYYFCAAFALGVGMLLCGILLAVMRNRFAARVLFVYSIAYLPLLLAFLLLDRSAGW